jgi:hypothetical protein
MKDRNDTRTQSWGEAWRRSQHRILGQSPTLGLGRPYGTTKAAIASETAASNRKVGTLRSPMLRADAAELPEPNDEGESHNDTEDNKNASQGLDTEL